ncbi:hypothetical protein TSA66_17195 [Noviherbaspirillum autotrophicum]|uniref:Methyl-accepting transducer domain-containing protein n=2 Tax=Noviherbaspirillum autotrophicum TaxID=709839 RepID=A0A0C1YNG2_9BURK|nr:hypothetical protein TSA66_17195 [Noviherbaspirillum autotrophicum]
MDEIVTSVKHVADIMSEIAAASAEQSSGIEQVNQAVTQMDTLTQQNAALVEEAAAAAESMQDQAARLTQAVAVFKLSAVGEQRVFQVQSAATPVLGRKQAPLAVAKAKLPSAGAGGDDWEEF